ncbi:MAG: hypothetical protein IPO67_12385 [Deltaproteobacteria bacterium]|nr:hypothetical protein [Deltaproteobacteria bacterium]
MSMREAIRQVRDAAQTLNARGPKPFPIVVQGLEAVIVGGVLGVERKDWIVPGLRERVGAVLRGCPVERLADASVGARPYRVAPVSQDPANRLLHAVGLSLAERDRATLCFVGQGSASCGAFHEALNLAALHRVNLIIVAHTWNLDEPGAPLARQLAGTLASKAPGLRRSRHDRRRRARHRGALGGGRGPGARRPPPHRSAAPSRRRPSAAR